MVQEHRWALGHMPSKLIFLVENDTILEEFLVQAIAEETPYLLTAVHTGFQGLEELKDFNPHLFLLNDWLPRMKSLELSDRLQSLEEVVEIPTIM